MYTSNNLPHQQSSALNSTQFQSGITQPPGLHPKKVIKIYGQEYVLCKDAADPTTQFPHNRVKIQEGDCVHVKDADIDVYFCYLHGIIQPLPNSLEKPVNVYYTGFHDHMIDLRYITPADVSRMHVYKVEANEWATEFVRNMLGAASTTQTDRDPISPFPPGFMLKSEEKKESPSQSSNTLKTLINRGDEE
jgi:hypothetical protein